MAIFNSYVSLLRVFSIVFPVKSNRFRIKSHSSPRSPGYKHAFPTTKAMHGCVLPEARLDLGANSMRFVHEFLTPEIESLGTILAFNDI